MWPIRARRLTDLIPVEELRLLLSRQGDAGSAITFCEVAPDGEIHSVELDSGVESHQPDPFCTFFRHGSVDDGRSRRAPAFEGADEACSRCERRFARTHLAPDDRRSQQESRVQVVAEQGVRRRCHMGLTDTLVAVRVAGQIVGGLVAGRRVPGEEDRQRIRKSVGKLGKLTRAEREHFDAREHIVIRPHDDEVRGRLLAEIDSIPLCSEEFDARLGERAAVLSRLAGTRYDAFRREQEELLLGTSLAWPDEMPRSRERILVDLAGVLSHLRLSLALGYVAVFAAAPEEMDDVDRPLRLVAEVGLDLSPEERTIELDWTRIPPPASGDGADVSYGRDAVSSLISALRQPGGGSEQLKGRLTKSLFLTPVELGSSWRGAVAFGPPRSGIEPDDADLRFLCRIGGELVRRYYAFCLAVDRAALSRRVADLEKELRAIEEEQRKEELAKKKIPPGQRFDLRKLLAECCEELRPAAETRSLPLDTRELADRLVVVGERRHIRDVLRTILTMGVERSCSDVEDQPLSPLRLVLKRRGRSAEVSVEAVGNLLTPGERRRLFRRAKGRGEVPDPTEPAPRAAPAGQLSRGDPTSGRASLTENAPEGSAQTSSTPTEAVEGTEGAPPVPAKRRAEETRAGCLRDVEDVVRRHHGRFRVNSERLHRFANDEHRWMGKTTFVVELPLPPRRMAKSQ